MSDDSSPAPTLAELRAAARAQGVDPSHADLEAAAGFLATILPELRSIEEQTARDVPPAGMYFPDVT